MDNREDEIIFNIWLKENNYYNDYKKLEELGYNQKDIKNVLFKYPESINDAIDELENANLSENGNNKYLVSDEEEKNNINLEQFKMNNQTNIEIMDIEKDYIPEKKIITKKRPITFNNFKRYLYEKDAVCKIITRDGIGTGFFCTINIKDYKMKILFTNNHILDKEKIKNGSNIEIEHDNKTKYIEINYKRFVCTNEDLDYTCIQIFDDDNFNKFFKIDDKINYNNPYEEYKNEKFVIIQYPKGKDISSDEGFIENITNNNITYFISTKSSSSGSPIILIKNLKVIGIHCGQKNNQNLNGGKFIKPILDDIETYFKKRIKPLKQIQFENKIYDVYTKSQFEQNNSYWYFD